MTELVREGVRYHGKLRHRLGNATEVFDAVGTIIEIGGLVGALVAAGAATFLGLPLIWAIAGLAGLVLLLFCVLVYAEIRSGLTVTPDGVVITNGFRSRRFAWDELSRFEASDGDAEAILRSSTRVPIRGLRDRTDDGMRHWWLINELNERLAARQRAANSGFWGQQVG